MKRRTERRKEGSKGGREKERTDRDGRKEGRKRDVYYSSKPGNTCIRGCRGRVVPPPGWVGPPFGWVGPPLGWVGPPLETSNGVTLQKPLVFIGF